MVTVGYNPSTGKALWGTGGALCIGCCGGTVPGTCCGGTTVRTKLYIDIFGTLNLCSGCYTVTPYSGNANGTGPNVIGTFQLDLTQNSTVCYWEYFGSRSWNIGYYSNTICSGSPVATADYGLWIKVSSSGLIEIGLHAGGPGSRYFGASTSFGFTGSWAPGTSCGEETGISLAGGLCSFAFSYLSGYYMPSPWDPTSALSCSIYTSLP